MKIFKIIVLNRLNDLKANLDMDTMWSSSQDEEYSSLTTIILLEGNSSVDLSNPSADIYTRSFFGAIGFRRSVLLNYPYQNSLALLESQRLLKVIFVGQITLIIWNAILSIMVCMYGSLFVEIIAKNTCIMLYYIQETLCCNQLQLQMLNSNFETKQELLI